MGAFIEDVRVCQYDVCERNKKLTLPLRSLTSYRSSVVSLAICTSEASMSSTMSSTSGGEQVAEAPGPRLSFWWNNEVVEELIN